MATPTDQQPLTILDVDGCQVTLLGTAHVSRASAEAVTQQLNSGEYDAVAVELCPSRHQSITDPDAVARMDLFEVFRQGKTPMVVASLALSAYQQRIADELGIEPGAEMRAALHAAEQKKIPALLIDREIGATLKRVSGNIGWWRRLLLLSGFIGSLFSHDSISEEEIEQMKEGDILEATLFQFAEQNQKLFLPLIEERDHYMAARLLQELQGSHYQNVLVVIGAGHMKGISQQLSQTPLPSSEASASLLTKLEQTPPPSRILKLFPWLIVLLVLSGFALGFSRSTALGWQMVVEWVVINGGLSALGALLAAAHLLTIIIAFLAAPLTSLNPMIGAGMVTAATETWLRKPNVGDFARLRKDVTHLKGWWGNRVARTLLVFLFSTLGSAAGTYIAGFRIFERLM